MLIPSFTGCDPEPTFSRHWPTKNILRQVVEEVGTDHLTARNSGVLVRAGHFRLKLRPFTSINLRMMFPPAGG